jgi:hypothetical protein
MYAPGLLGLCAHLGRVIVSYLLVWVFRGVEALILLTLLLDLDVGHGCDRLNKSLDGLLAVEQPCAHRGTYKAAGAAVLVRS